MWLDVQGQRAYAYTGGRPFDPSAPTVVFIHGGQNDHSVWILQTRYLAHHGYGVLAVDLPGHGRSAGKPLAGIEEMAQWLLALLDAAGVERATLVGHSMGSLIALEVAARAPQRARRLVMVGTAYPMKVSDALLSTARDAPLKAIEMVNSFSISSLATKPSYPGPGMWLHGANRALMRRTLRGCPGLNLFEHDFSVCNRYDGGLAAAAKVSCPAHFILGANDQMTPPKATREIAAALKANVVTIPASGHSMMVEQPDAFLAALRRALA